MSYYITTAIDAEELYNLIKALDYMTAIKILKDAGYDVSRMTPFYWNDYSIDRALDILEQIEDAEITDMDEHHSCSIHIETTKEKAEKIMQKIEAFSDIDDSVIKTQYKATNKTLTLDLDLEGLSYNNTILHQLAPLVVEINKIKKGEEK